MLQFSPKKKEVDWVVTGRPLSDHLFRLSVRNAGGQRVRPVFVTPAAYVTVGASGSDVEAVPRFLPGGREIWRASQALEPRATRDFFVFLDPMSPSLPKKGTRQVNAQIEIMEEVDGHASPVGTLPIVLKEIRGAPPAFHGIVAVDFGTTNTCVVLSTADRWQPHLLFESSSTIGGDGEAPSLVAYLDVEDPDAPGFEIGREARVRIGNLGADEVISSVKRYVGADTRFLVGSSTVQGLVYYRAREVATHFLKELKRHVERALGERAVVELVCTFPTAFNSAQVDALAEVYEGVQAGLAEEYGDAIVPYRMFVDEATAAAVFHLQRHFGDLGALREKITGEEFSILCYDLGGGTTDVSLTRFRLEEPKRAESRSQVALEDIDEFLDPDSDADEESRPPSEAFPVVNGRILGRDGLDLFGGDNMSLAVFRLLKARYALLLAKHVLDTTSPTAAKGAADLRAAALEVLAAREILERWLAAGDPVGPDVSVGFKGQVGANVPEDVWNPIDVLVPTRHHLDYDFRGPEREARHQIFFDLWQSAEAAKIGFGTPGTDGVYPKSVEVPPPPALLDRYGIGPHKLRCALMDHELRPHLEPSLVLGLARANALVSEAGLEKVSFFILAGNACKLPLVRQLFQAQMASVGAVEGQNVFFDPAVAKTAVASGACLLAVYQALRSGVQWKFEEEEDTLRDFIGTMTTAGVFTAQADRFVSWFHQGQPVPAHTAVRMPVDLPTLRVVAMRRLLGEARPFGSFLFRESTGRFGWDDLPDDLAEAVEHFGLSAGEEVEPVGECLVDVVLTKRRRVFLQRGSDWFAMWPTRQAPPPRQDPFSGRQ